MKLARTLLPRHRAIACWLLAVTLFMKIMVPPGYMVGTEGGRLTVQLCSGYGAMPMRASPAMSMAGGGHHADHPGNHGKGEMPCAFAAVGAHAVSAADPLLLAVALLFILLTGFRLRRGSSAAASRPHLRPPLRGPPAHR